MSTNLPFFSQAANDEGKALCGLASSSWNDYVGVGDCAISHYNFDTRFCCRCR